MNWQKVKLNELIEKPISGEWGSGEGKVKVIRTTNFTNDGTLNLSDVVSRDIPQSKVDKKKLRKGDIIIEKSGGSPTQPVGRVVHFLEETEQYLCNNFTSVLRPNENINSRYLFWCLFSGHVNGSTLKYQNKTTGIINLKLERFCQEFEIPLPALPIQQHIADTLDKADALRRKDQELLDKYDELAQAVFYEMFGDPVRNEKGWEIKSVIEMADCIVPGRDKPKSFTGKIPWITTEDLQHLNYTHKSKKGIGLTESEIKSARARKIPKNSIIMTCVGDLGVVSLAGFEMVVNQQLHTFQCKSINPIFLMFALSLQKNYMIKMASSTTLPYMNKTICNSIPIIAPPLKMQEVFSIFIKNLNSQIEKVKIGLELSNNLIKTQTNRCFNGS